MVQIVPCENCGGTHIGLGEVSVNVVLSKGFACNICHHGHIDTQNHFFCSLDCFDEFIAKNHIEWKDSKEKIQEKSKEHIFGEHIREAIAALRPLWKKK